MINSPITPDKSGVHRSREAELQLLFQELQKEIKTLPITSSEKKRLQGLLGQYRSAWNSYINFVKPKRLKTNLRGGSTNRLKKDSPLFPG